MKKTKTKPFTIDINAEGTLSAAKARTVETFVLGLDTHAATAHAFIVKQLGNKRGKTVTDFLEFHVEELAPKTLAKLLDKKSKSPKLEQLAAKLVLTRVGIYPQAKADGFAVLDYTFEGNTGKNRFTDQLLAVYMDAKGKVGHLSHES